MHEVVVGRKWYRFGTQNTVIVGRRGQRRGTKVEIAVHTPE